MVFHSSSSPFTSCQTKSLAFPLHHSARQSSHVHSLSSARQSFKSIQVLFTSSNKHPGEERIAAGRYNLWSSVWSSVLFVFQRTAVSVEYSVFRCTASPASKDCVQSVTGCITPALRGPTTAELLSNHHPRVKARMVPGRSVNTRQT